MKKEFYALDSALKWICESSNLQNSTAEKENNILEDAPREETQSQLKTSSPAGMRTQ